MEYSILEQTVVVPDDGPMQITQLLGDGTFQALVPAKPMEISQLLGDGSFVPLRVSPSTYPRSDFFLDVFFDFSKFS